MLTVIIFIPKTANVPCEIRETVIIDPAESRPPCKVELLTPRAWMKIVQDRLWEVRDEVESIIEVEESEEVRLRLTESLSEVMLRVSNLLVFAPLQFRAGIASARAEFFELVIEHLNSCVRA